LRLSKVHELTAKVLLPDGCADYADNSGPKKHCQDEFHGFNLQSSTDIPRKA
jgi:hypothetical protein